MLTTLTGGGIPSPPTDFDESSDDQAVQEIPTSKPPAAAFASAVAAPVFDLIPQFGKKVSKNYLEGMLKRVSSNQHPTTEIEEKNEDLTAFEAPKLSKGQGQAATAPKKTFNFFQYTKTSLN